MRFAHDHAPDPPPRSFWIAAGALFLLLAVPVALVNLAVDPFDFRLAPHLPLVRDKLMKTNDSMLWSAGEFRRIPRAARDQVTISFLGDSRTEGICRWPSSPRIFRLGPDVVFNLAVSGASFEETIRLLELELPRLPHLRGVVLALPIERIGVSGINRTSNALRLVDTPLLYVLGLGTLASSFELVIQKNLSPAQRWANGEIPDLDPAHLPDESAVGLDVAGNIAKANAAPSPPLSPAEQKNAAMWRKTLLRVEAALVERRVRDIVAPLVQRLHARGIAVAFLIPPLHPEVRRALGPAQLAIHEHLVTALGALGPVEDFSRGDRSGLVPKFTDALHVQPDTAHAILGDIYVRNFGRPAAVTAR